MLLAKGQIPVQKSMRLLVLPEGPEEKTVERNYPVLTVKPKIVNRIFALIQMGATMPVGDG